MAKSTDSTLLTPVFGMVGLQDEEATVAVERTFMYKTNGQSALKSAPQIDVRMCHVH